MANTAFSRRDLLKSWGALDNNYHYTGETGSPQRGYDKDAGAFIMIMLILHQFHAMTS